MGAAFRFLTVMPFGRAAKAPTPISLAAFPVVGVFIGLLWALTATLVERYQLFPVTAVGGALVLIVDALVTGGLHLDALADVGDGVGSRKPAAAAVEVMRDSSIGAIGAATLVLICLLRYALLTTPAAFAWRLLAVPTAGRLAMVVLIWLVPARADGSLAQAFGTPSTTPMLLAAVVATVVATVAAGIPGLVGLLLVVVFTFVYGLWWQRRFGPMSGDGIGACGVLAETLMLATVAAGGFSAPALLVR